MLASTQDLHLQRWSVPAIIFLLNWIMCFVLAQICQILENKMIWGNGWSERGSGIQSRFFILALASPNPANSPSPLDALTLYTHCRQTLYRLSNQGSHIQDWYFLKDKVDPSVLFLDFFLWSWTCFCILKSLPLYFTLDTINGVKSAGRLPSCKPTKQNTND